MWFRVFLILSMFDPLQFENLGDDENLHLFSLFSPIFGKRNASDETLKCRFCLQKCHFCYIMNQNLID
jgi:hypothetical protein